jgi:acetyl esterase
MESVELDERMTEETKAFVSASLKIATPSLVIKTPVSVIRQTRETNAEKLLASLDFNGLQTKEVFVKNKFDDFEVPVTILTPIDIRNDTSITIFIHGGGWTFGSRRTHFHAAASLANLTKTIFVSIDYRLAPEHKFNKQISDCQSVVEWVLANKMEITSNQNAKLGLMGDSAGGHYSAILAHEYKNLFDYQILVYPCVHLNKHYNSYDQFKKDCYILVPDVIDFFTSNLVDDLAQTSVPTMSPILNEDYSNLPKCLIIAAELDPLVDHSTDYFNKLKENNVECDLHIIKGTIHGFFHNGTHLKNAFEECAQIVGDYFKKI